MQAAVPRALVVGGGLACLTMLGWLSTRAADPPRAIRSVAVLPVSNLTGDPRLDHYGDAVNAMLVADLGRRPELAVVSRGSTRRFGGSPLPAKEVGKALEVEGLLEAAVLWSDGRIRVAAELVDARTDRLVWAEVFEGDASELMEIEDLIAEAVLSAIQLPAASEAATVIRTGHAAHRPLPVDACSGP